MLGVARALVRFTLLITPLFVWPWAREPFVTPRLGFLGASVAATAVLLVVARAPWPRWPPVVAWSTLWWLAWIGVSATFAPHASLDSLVVLLTAVAWGAVLWWSAVERRAIAAALVASATIVGAWATLQWLGIDPFKMTGWRVITAESPRMRVYASLGNPNYVGAFLVSALPVSIALARLRASALSVMAVALQVAGIAATGSRAAWLGSVGGITFLVVRDIVRDGRPTGRFVAAAIATMVLVGLAILLGPARPLDETLRGRIYIWSVAAPHLLDHPVTGVGPGGFAAEYPVWEAERLTRGVDDDVRRYFPPMRHAHNDYIETLAEFGIPGLVSWLALVGGVVWHGWHEGAGIDSALAGGAAAGAAGLCAVALVDFPFARLVETMGWWTLVTMAVAPPQKAFIPRP